MKATATQKPEPFLRYGHTRAGQVTFNVQQTEQPDPEDTNERWEYDYVEVPENQRNKIITAIIRSKYNQDSVEALMANFQKGEKMVAFMQFQNFRDLAKAVASGQHLATELEEFYNRKVYEIELPFNETLAGGKYAALADYALKAKNFSVADVPNKIARVYVSWLLPDHSQLLANDPAVTITEHQGIV
jgi:hypothetical protein